MGKNNTSVENNIDINQRKSLCWKFYIDPKSKTFGNAYKSALKAGYSNSHSLNITTDDWFKDRKAKLRREGMLDKAEGNIEKILSIEYQSNGEINGEALRVVADMSKTIAKTLGKEHYSERSEVTGKDGESLIPKPLLGGKSNGDSNDSNS